mgnify:CR=1 FL=1
MAIELANRSSGQFFVEGFQFVRIFILQHEVSCTQNGCTNRSRDQVRMGVRQLAEFAAALRLRLYTLMASRMAVIGDFMTARFLPMAFDFIVCVIGELLAGSILTDLRMSQEDNRHLVFHGNLEVLTHRTQGIAQNRRNDSVNIIEGPIKQHFEGLLSNRAVEGCTVFLGTDLLFAVAAPDSHRNHTSSIDEFFRNIVSRQPITFLP